MVAPGSRVVVAPRWVRGLAVLAPVVGVVLGIAMALQWALTGLVPFDQGAPGAGVVGPWVSERVRLLGDDGEPLWLWRGPWFLSLVLVQPLVWRVTRGAPAGARWCTRAGLLVATAATALEYDVPGGPGWLVDLAGLLLAVAGTAACGVSGLRRRSLPAPVARALVAVVPLTPLGGFLVFWYLPPGLAVGLLLAWALVAVLLRDPATPAPREPG